MLYALTVDTGGTAPLAQERKLGTRTMGYSLTHSLPPSA